MTGPKGDTPAIEQFTKELLQCLGLDTMALMQNDLYTAWRNRLGDPDNLPFSLALCVFMDELTDIVDRATKES